MKHFIFFVSFFALTIHFFQSFGQAWEQTISFPGTPRDDAAYFKIGNKHFIGTGREVGFGCTRDFYYFDENTLSWQSSSPLPIGEERQYAIACAWNDRGYLLGGVDCLGIHKNDFWEYNPNTDTWIPLPNSPFSGRAGMVQFILNNTLYIIGGRNAGGILNEVWTYDFITQIWNQKNNLPTDGIWRGIAFTFENNAYIGLGKNNLNNQTAHNSELLNYLPLTDSWAVVPNVNFGMRSYLGCAQTDSLLFLFGGLSEANEILISTERIQLNNFSIELLADFPTEPRKGGIAFLVENDLYFTTGISVDTRFNESWLLTGIASMKEINSSNIQIFPNPANQIISISLIGEKPIGISCNILDAHGRQVKSISLVEATTPINISDLLPGIYFVKIGSLVKKVVFN